MNKIINVLVFLFLISIITIVLAIIALNNGENINAVWILSAAICVYIIGYRYYSLYIAKKALVLDSTRLTPAYKFYDGLDYVPTNKTVLFGHHFAAIAGAGPLVGPVLASQMGYLPGMLWILAGVIFAGAVQDFVILTISTRHGGKSLGQIIEKELGKIPGFIGMISCYIIMIIILAALGMILVKATTHSPWSVSIIAITIPIALFMGIYLKFIRKGKILEISIFGFIALIVSIMLGKYISEHNTLKIFFDLQGTTLTYFLMLYGLISAMLPVWLLLAPRDYLATFLKIGTILFLALGIFIVMPKLQMPMLTQFAKNGVNGPVWSGDLFPFLFITIACGAVSGFHALISSGTTPKMVANETHTRMLGYGAMLMESFVAIMALLAACVINPGIYFIMNSPITDLNPSGANDLILAASQTVSSWGFNVSISDIEELTRNVGETSIISRAGGAPTLAIGMAYILHNALGGIISQDFWYHFAILFEALFILTALDAGTRSSRFMLQELLGFISEKLKQRNLLSNLIITIFVVSSWGFFVYNSVIDPTGGVKALWPLFGIGNQMLACIALYIASVYLFKTKKHKYSPITLIPASLLFIFTIYAGTIKVFDKKIGFFGIASSIKEKYLVNQFIADNYYKTIKDVNQAIINNYIDGVLTLIFMFCVIVLVFFSIKSMYRAYKNKEITTTQLKYEVLNNK